MKKTVLFLSLLNTVRGYSPSPLLSSNSVLHRGRIPSFSAFSVIQSDNSYSRANSFANRLTKTETYSTSSEASVSSTSTTEESQVSNTYSIDSKSIELLIPQYNADHDYVYRISYSHLDGDSDIVNVFTLSSTGLKAKSGKILLENLISNTEYKIRIQAQKKESDTFDLVKELKVTTQVASSPSQSNKDGEQAIEEQGDYTEFSRLEIKVGKILEVERHPDADGLYVEKIDVGEEEPRTIVSGLVKFIKKEEFEGLSTLVLCNLKPRAMRGITSAGMVLCASNEDHTEVWPLLAPEGCAPGDIVRVEGHQYKPDAPGNRAGKAFTKVADDLHVNDDFEATYKGGKFTTTSGVIKSTLKGSIS